MPQTQIKLDSELVKKARAYGKIYERSAPKQIEYWSKIGRIVEENPDLPYEFIQDILTAQNEESTPFEFRDE